MKYTFKKYDWDGDTIHGIDAENKVLNNLGSWNWSQQKVQEIIDGVQKNRTLSEDEDPYVWGNEDVTIFSNKIGILLIDKMALRAGKEVTPLELTHDEFIKFLEDFKEFVAKNS